MLISGSKCQDTNGVPVITAPIAMRATTMSMMIEKSAGEWTPVTRFVKSPDSMMEMTKPFYRIGE